MKASVHIFILLTLVCSLCAFPPNVAGAETRQDSAEVKDALMDKLKIYLEAIEREDAQTKCKEADFLIESCRDSLIRQKVATRIYEHFSQSKLMGDEAVAIHLYDKWFADGRVAMGSEFEWWAAKFHAEVNRQSLLGCKAPELGLQNPDGGNVYLFEEDGKSGATGLSADTARKTLLYFYDVGCPQCLVESIKLRNLLENSGYKLNFYAVYTGKDREKWEEYRKSRLNIISENAEVMHLWDPDGVSGMEYKYAVIDTPQLFLIDENNIIIGRRLDTEAVELLLAAYQPMALNYGSEEAMQLFDAVFAPMRDKMNCESVSETAEYISQSTLSKGDTLTYKQLIGDLLYYTSNRREAAFKCGTSEFTRKYILDRPDIWDNTDDSLKVVNLAELMKGISELSPVGSRMPKLRVPATMKWERLHKDGSKTRTAEKTFKLDKAKNLNIFFFTDGCDICKAEKEAADRLQKEGQAGRILYINMDELWSSYPEIAEALMRNFDLSSLPFILSTDKKGRISGKYLSFNK